ncbi:MAG: BamA/TamA family outer membrane protein [Betaproteobacteria bacterium]|nr:BamA/TamA family outer membrane protein [Betaproteobacteria bacterium]
MRCCVRPYAILVAILCTSGAAHALEYRVDIKAPEALAAPLRKGLNLMRWQGDPQMTPGLLRRLADEAAADARALAAAEGYFSPQVRVAIDEAAQPWRVLLELEPGERTSVAAVDIRFSGPGSEDPQARELLGRVRKSWPLLPGRPFRQEDWEAAKRRAVSELSRWRYAAARVAASEARVDPGSREARLVVELDSGPPFRFGPVLVSGTQRYAPELVENLSPVRPGVDYDRAELVVYQRRLTETGYFASVQADIEARPENAAAAPLRVTVIEAPSKQVEGGVSYSTDVGPRFQLRYGDHDLRDSAWRLGSALALDRKIQELKLDLDAPPRAGARWNNYFARAARTDIQNEIARSFSLGIAHNFGADLAPSAAVVSWHLEDQRAGSVITDSRHAVYVGLRRSFRRTDEIIAPRSGYFGNVEIGGGIPGLSTERFLRATAQANLLLPAGRSGELLLRAQSGVVISDVRQGIPTEFLFRTGGDWTVRGYAFESLGVREADAIVGGRRLFVTSAEYTHWIGENWGLAVFVDAGDAWDEGERFDAALGYGLGVRLRTPIGPARADLAYGKETEEYRLHISIGYVF